MRATLAFLLVLGTCLTAGAQHLYDANWLFGYKCGLSFVNGTPQAIEEAALLSDEACASISNSYGELQLYTNGINVWNKDHQVMDNGTGLWVGQNLPNGAGTSATQGVLILPSITDSSQYLIFTQNSFPDTGIRVSTVDMTFNGGLGKVLSKNEPVYQGHWFSEKLAACRHANGRDWWLVSFESATNCNRYSVLLYSPEGIGLKHIDTVGLSITYNGQMVFSRQGSFLGNVSPFGKIQILNFDRCTGKLTNNSSFSYNAGTYFKNNTFYGACFSPDESKFYVSAMFGQDLLQFSKESIAQTFNSPEVVWNAGFMDTNTFGSPCSRVFFGQMQLGTDDRIYCNISPACSISTAWSNYQHSLSVINKPNEQGVVCNFQPASVPVGNAPHYLLNGLPNLPNYNLGRLIGSPCDTLHTAVDNIEEPRFSSNLYPNPNTGNFSLMVDPDEAGHLTIAVTDLLGRVLVKQTLQEGQAVYEVNAGLPSGSYQCVVYKSTLRKQTIPFVVINE